MSLASIRRRSAPVALLVFVTLVSTSRGARAAPRSTGAVTGITRVHTPAEAIARAPARPTHADHVEERARDDVHEEAAKTHPARVTGSMAAASEAVRSGGTAAPVSQALPTGVDKTGVSSQAISVPQGAGKSQGMGESFSAQLSTGAGSFTVPFALPAARGDAQPSVRLSYSSASGHGVAGVGWDVGVPYIACQTDRGLPQYDDRDAWHPNQDRFVFSGGQELVPIGRVVGASCTGALPSESMPGWANGWQYFRPRVEGGGLRFFWSPDHRAWRVQSKTGESLELGAPLDGTTSTGAIELDPSSPERVFRCAEGAANRHSAALTPELRQPDRVRIESTTRRRRGIVRPSTESGRISGPRCGSRTELLRAPLMAGGRSAFRPRQAGTTPRCGGGTTA